MKNSTVVAVYVRKRGSEEDWLLCSEYDRGVLK